MIGWLRSSGSARKQSWLVAEACDSGREEAMRVGSWDREKEREMIVSYESILDGSDSPWSYHFLKASFVSMALGTKLSTHEFQTATVSDGFIASFL